MARKTVNAGLNEDFIRSLGVVPWDERATPGHPTYVRGKYDNDPLGTLLWIELRLAYKRHKIDARSATMFELRLAGQSYRDIMRLFKLKSPRSVQYRVLPVMRLLRADPKLGMVTSIFEQCGGWRAVGEYLKW